MSYTRRTLLKQGATYGTALAALHAMPRPLFANVRGYLEPVPPIEDPDIKRLTDASLSVAREAGAIYADVRLTHTYTRRIGMPPPHDESMTFGVRALVDGYWGFAASPVWTIDEAVRLGRSAARNAKANVLGKTRTVDFAPVASVANGHWTTPILEDPFTISIDEVDDYLTSLGIFIRRLSHVTAIQVNAEFVKQDKVFASTADQYFTQRFYRTSGTVGFGLYAYGRDGGAKLDCLTPASAGFEYFRKQPLREAIIAAHAEAIEDMSFPIKPVDVGRYETVFDAVSVANAISSTIGMATELDRALGYEANATGTSYITDPAAMVGTLKIGAPAFTVTANRSEPLGAASVKWDDDGVLPQEFTVIKNGILTDLQTDREGAGWLKDWYAKQNMPVGSRGCAYAPDALFPPMTHSANLRVEPGSGNATLASLVSGVSKGLLWKRTEMDMDFQQVTGLGYGNLFEIKNGKRVAGIAGAGLIFRTSELWNAITSMGGPGSQQRFGLAESKGQPVRSSYHSVTAVPMTFKELTVIDVTRKA